MILGFKILKLQDGTEISDQPKQTTEVIQGNLAKFTVMMMQNNGI